MIHLNVLLLTVEPPGPRLFYGEIGRREPVARPGRFARWLRGVRARWKRAGGRGAEAGRKVWAWLHSWTHPDERLYALLRQVRIVTARYPLSMTAEEASRAWKRFLAAGLWRHAPRFLLNLAVAPATIFLAFLPGPNLVGYWFVYRAIHHLLILYGLIRVRSGWAPTRFEPTEALDRPIGAGDDLATLADRLSARGLLKKPRKLEAFLQRRGVGDRRAGVPLVPSQVGGSGTDDRR